MENSINENIVLVPDSGGGYTSFFKQLPNVIAEGDTKREAISNLLSLICKVLTKDDIDKIRIKSYNYVP